jgi:hypothetical protein
MSALTQLSRGLVLLPWLALAACGGGRSKPESSGWVTREGYTELGQDEMGEPDLADDSPAVSTTPGWTGVRHDLGLRPEPKRQAVCSCLAVEVGPANDAKFLWRGGKPDVDPKNVAVAITAQGVECSGGPANPADRRPSISAIDRVGKDVVVEIEEVPADRPLATGAILNPIEVGGKVYLKPRNKKTIYARPTGKELCRVR